MRILDTDTLSNLVRKRPCDGLVQRFHECPDVLAVSVVSLAEIHFGVARNPRLHGLAEEYEREVFAHVDVLDFDPECARTCGRVRADLEQRGEPIGIVDTMIAATALRHGATLVTGNVRHFSRVPGLRLENWLGDD